MHVTPRTCPGPGDLWQPSWQEEKRQAEYERLLEDFFEKYIPRYCDERINQLAEDGEDGLHEYWKFVPSRNNPEGYPGLYYPCKKKTRGAIKATRVMFK